jgi:putative nucleotidyltransferase with HDIG domain
VVLAHSLNGLWDAPHPEWWLLVSAFALVSGFLALKVPGVPVYLSVSDTFYITSCLLFGPGPATLTIALDSLVMSWWHGSATYKILFNTTSSAVSLWSAGQVFFWLTGSGPLIEVEAPPGVLTMLQVACLAVVYFAFNSGLVTTAIALQQKASIVTLWRQHFSVVAFGHLAAASASFVLLVLFRSVSPLAVAAIVPLLMMFQLAMRSWVGRLEDAAHHLGEVTRLHLSTVSALSTAIEAKDGVTSNHIHRVRAYAVGLAHALGVKDSLELQAVETASLLHDTGKMAIPEHILNKPGKLTADEFETMKSHVQIGVDILSSIDFPYPVIPIVRAHHENWDGSGYPAGILGDKIPLGARILSVVDCFDALTSDRPYRPAMTADEADAILLKRRGTMYDPQVVDAFLRSRHAISVAEPSPQLQKALGSIRRVRETVVPIAVPQLIDVPPDASEQMLALVSLARVASQAPTVGDVGTLAWTHIRQLVPRASLALFVVDTAHGDVVARYTAGPAAARLATLVLEFGQGMSGWVAANARSVVNSDARLDLTRDAGETLRFGLAVPLTVHGSVVGVMTLYAPEKFEDDQSRMIEMIAPHLAVSIELALGPSWTLWPLENPRLLEMASIFM